MNPMTESIKLSSGNKPLEYFLPDFCQVTSVFLVVLIGELLAIVFTLLNLQPGMSVWQLLGIYSISVQMILLPSIAILCVSRSYFASLNEWVAGLYSLAIILLVTLVFSLIAISGYSGLLIDLAQPEQRFFILRNLLVSGLIGTFALRYFYLQYQYRKQLSAEASARLEALQSRIRPHFLFNSMNVIASLTRVDPAKAEQAIEDLADLFRAVLQENKPLITLEEELKNCEHYLAIEQLRLGDRLRVNMNIAPQTLSCLFPPLTLQPLLENAVYHGIQESLVAGEIAIETQIENQRLQIIISNPLSQTKASSNHFHGHGMAINNIKQRLAMVYQGQASLTQQIEPKHYRAILTVPVQAQPQGGNKA